MALKNIPKKSGRLYLGLLFVCIALMLMMKHCSVKRDVPFDPEADDPEAMRVAIEYSPLAVIADGDSLTGFGYELIRALADTARFHIRIYPVVSLPKALEGLDSGRYDLVIGELPMTATMKSRYTMTRPVYTDRQVLVQVRDSAGKTPVMSQLDLAGRRVSVVTGSPAEARLGALSREIGDTIYVDARSDMSPELLFTSVAIGDLPLAVVNMSIAQSLAGQYPQIDLSTPVSFTQFQSWAVADSLRQRVDSALVLFQKSSRYISLLRRYNLTAPE